jgi:pimeloyl-ACP methyl ester carboxylesterase
MYARKALRRWLALICLILAWPFPLSRAADAQAANPDAELAAAITVGEPQWLEADGKRFLGIYTRSTTGGSLGGAIILPSLGRTPDWPDVIAPLRKALPAHSWNTLAIELPLPAKGADGLWQLEPYFTASRSRIQSAINYLQQQGITNIVLIGHGLGAAAAAVCVSGNNPLKVSGLAAISLGAPPGSEAKPYGPDLLEKIHVPILDIYGSRDFDEVTASAAARATAARRGELAALRSQQLEALKRSPQARHLSTNHNGYIAYRQLELMGADHTFRAAEPTLIKRIMGWLKKHSEGGDASIPPSGSG